MLDLLAGVRSRVRSDFLMRSRLDRYQLLLEAALGAGYRILPVGAFWRQVNGTDAQPAGRYLVLRHDVDTDPHTAAVMWGIDRTLDVQGSYFFRLSTVSRTLIADIARGGGEPSYHYEELATVAKRRGLRRPADALAHLTEARELFSSNIGRLRASTGLPMRVVASHGDFVNRRLGIANWVILDSPEFRRQLDIDLETYDEAFLSRLPSRHIDAPPPRHWEPTDPLDAIRAGEPIISMLIHPRQWHADRMVNARDDVQRIFEGLRYSAAGRWSRPS